MAEKRGGMTKERIPVTPAILTMKQSGLAFILRPYRYEEHGGTRVSAQELGVDEHLLAEIAPAELIRILKPVTVKVAI